MVLSVVLRAEHPQHPLVHRDRNARSGVRGGFVVKRVVSNNSAEACDRPVA